MLLDPNGLLTSWFCCCVVFPQISMAQASILVNGESSWMEDEVVDTLRHVFVDDNIIRNVMEFIHNDLFYFQCFKCHCYASDDEVHELRDQLGYICDDCSEMAYQCGACNYWCHNDIEGHHYNEECEICDWCHEHWKDCSTCFPDDDEEDDDDFSDDDD